MGFRVPVACRASAQAVGFFLLLLRVSGFSVLGFRVLGFRVLGFRV